MKGKFLVIDGIDGSGKGKQCELLADRLLNKGYKVKIFDFPRYDQDSSLFVRKYLNGELGSLSEVDAYQASCFFALDRFCAKKDMERYLNEGFIILSNRYVSANKIHQSSKITDSVELEKFLDWLDDFEFEKLKVPRPDKVIFLDVPWEIGQKLILKKDAKSRVYAKGKVKDLHEADDNFMESSYARAVSLCDKYDSWKRIQCFDDNRDILSISNIHESVYEYVMQIIDDKP